MPALKPDKMSCFRSPALCLLWLQLVSAVAVTALIASGCGSEQAAAPGGPSESRAADAGTSPSTTHKSGSRYPVVRIDTTQGSITVKLDAVNAPGTVRNFLNYISDGFYSDTTFHYVAPGSLILGGGYTLNGQPKRPKFPPIRNEADNGQKNLRGTIAMARDAAIIDSATSQFFINLADAPQRDYIGEAPDRYGYCVFGEVIDGMEVADRIANSPTQDRGGDLAQSPQPPVAIQAIRLM